ncbi:MAG: hypothetical protein ACP5OO_02360 [Chloroflexia bacterium]
MSSIVAQTEQGRTRAPWWLLPSLYLLSVLVLAAAAAQVAGPLDLDGSYYFLVARNLARGRGLVVEAVWHFFQPPASLPQPAGDLWMPLPSLLMVPALLLGPTFRFAQAAQVLLAALLPLLAFRFARDAGASLPWATLAGLLTTFAGVVTIHWVDSDCYTAYALIGGAALYAMGRAVHRPHWLLPGGLLGGLAALTRNDGLLLLLVLWAAAFFFSRHRRSPFPWKMLLGGTALFLLPVLLWYGRNVLLFGRPTPVPLTFFLTLRDYRHLFAYQPQGDWAAFWAQGWGTLLAVRLSALGAALTVLAGDLQVWELAPLLVAALSLRRRPLLWPAFFYLAVLLLTLVGAFPLLVLHGTWSRSLPAFLPAGYAGVALGLEHLAEGLARRLAPHWPRRVHVPLLTLAAAAALLVGLVAAGRQLEAAHSHPLLWQQVGDWLRQHTPAGTVVMAQDPMAVALYAERPAVGIPYEDLPRLLEMARQYSVNTMVLVGRFSDLLPETLRRLYAGETVAPFARLWEEGEVQIYRLE